jgi:hypothetical protein
MYFCETRCTSAGVTARSFVNCLERVAPAAADQFELSQIRRLRSVRFLTEIIRRQILRDDTGDVC